MDPDRLRVFITVDLPVRELEGLLQALRGWDQARPEIATTIVADAPSVSMEEVRAIFARLNPPLPHIQVASWPEGM